MKYHTDNLKELGQHFVQMEEIISVLETLENGAPDMLATDKTSIKDLGLSKDDISMMEDILKVKISEESLIMDIAKDMKAQS
tara:strand:- start:5028 stop:5273 length:246 start_codon:yes stop_codon:yes gene_type:complete